MKLSAFTNHFKRSALVLAVALTPALSMAAIDEAHSQARQKERQANLSAVVMASVNEVAKQASLVQAAYVKLQASLATGNEKAIAADQEKLAARQADFMKAQHNVRANLLKMQSMNEKSNTATN